MNTVEFSLSHLLSSGLFIALHTCSYLRCFGRVLPRGCQEDAREAQCGLITHSLAFQKVNPNIEYYLKNSTDFIATRDGLILTNIVLESPGTVTIQVGQLSWVFWQGHGKKEEFKSSFWLGQRKQSMTLDL